MTHRLSIRDGRYGDANRLTVLASQVWLHTYATNGISPEIAQYVLSEFTPAKFEALLSNPKVILLVAELDSSIVGFATVCHDTPCPTGDVGSVELQTLYVQAHFIGQGIGQDLLNAAEASARNRSGSRIWLTVNAQNTRAIGFYDRQGYLKVGTTYFVLGESRHENHVLVGQNA